MIAFLKKCDRMHGCCAVGPFYPNVERYREGQEIFFWLLTLSMVFFPTVNLAFASASRTQRYPNGLLVVSASPHRPGYFSVEAGILCHGRSPRGHS